MIYTPRHINTTYENKGLDQETGSGGTELWSTRGVDGGIGVDEGKGKGSSDEGQQGQAIVVNRL